MSNNSDDKLRVEATFNHPFTSAKGHRKVVVELLRSRSFWPSFRDIWRIVRAIAQCEDERYPNGAGRGMVARFLVDAVYESDFNELARRWKIPERQGDQIVNANGANVPEPLLPMLRDDDIRW